MDLVSDVSFDSYANEKKPSNETERFLTIAAWFKQHRGVKAISKSHAYTCYRKMEWPTNMPDFAAPLRYLKKLQYMKRTGPGLYEINHLGEDLVAKLGKSE